MTSVAAKAYLSPSLVLLALDWSDGAERQDFLGFAIRRTPGFLDLATGAVAASSWLPEPAVVFGSPTAGAARFRFEYRSDPEIHVVGRAARGSRAGPNFGL